MASPKYVLEDFPEEYLLVEDEAGWTGVQCNLIFYIYDILDRLFETEKWHIGGDLELYHPAIQNSRNMITPDISVFKGIKMSPKEKQDIQNWPITPKNPAPPVVFEFSTHLTWHSDISEGEHNKPDIYGRMGVKEYFAYDPNEPQIWQPAKGWRLLGWRYEKGIPFVMQPDKQGRLWSNELNSWLVPDGYKVRLYDQDNNLRLTEGETDKKESRAKDLAIETLNQRIAEMERELRKFKGDSNQE